MTATTPPGPPGPPRAPGSYYERTGEHRFKPTEHAGGAWAEDEQHFAPVGGLMAHAIDRHLSATRPEGGLALARISYDILGRIPLDECEVTVETVRPGRTIELLEAVTSIGGRAVTRARAWLLTSPDTRSVADVPGERLAPPEEFEPWPMAEMWSGGYIGSVEVRRRAYAPAGRAAAWVRTPLDLVAGEESSPLASYLALVDTANGIAVQQSPTKWMFPNVDLTVHLHRGPSGPWAGLDTSVAFGPSGLGVTSTVLHDEHGPVGRAEQMLTVRPLPAR